MGEDVYDVIVVGGGLNGSMQHPGSNQAVVLQTG